MADDPSGHEKRQFPRAPIGVVVRVETPKGARHYYSKNLSPGGMFVLAEEPLLEETRVEVELFLPLVSTPVRAKGEVVWKQKQDPSGFAVKFTEISEAARKLIKWVVDRYLGQPGADSES
jgi:uncharacterized protein (TIGR02266 family)